MLLPVLVIALAVSINHYERAQRQYISGPGISKRAAWKAANKMRRLSEQRKGELLAVAEITIWGFFPIVLSPKVNRISPLYTGAAATLLAVIPFALRMTAGKKWYELKERKAWLPMFLAGLLIGSCYYSLIFIALPRTSPANASLLLLMEIFFSVVFLAPVRGERLSARKTLGALFMLVGAGIVLAPEHYVFNSGDLLILLACAVAPLGNLSSKTARGLVSSDTILFIRSAIGGTFLLVLAWFLEPPPAKAELSHSLAFLIVNGFLMMGLSKILWLEAIHRIPIPKAVSIMALTPFVTIAAAVLLLDESLTVRQGAACLPIVVGMLLLTQNDSAGARAEESSTYSEREPQ